MDVTDDVIALWAVFTVGFAVPLVFLLAEKVICAVVLRAMRAPEEEHGPPVG